MFCNLKGKQHATLNNVLKYFTFKMVAKAVGFREFRQIFANFQHIPESMKIFMLNHNQETHNKHYKVTGNREQVAKIQEIQRVSHSSKLGYTYPHMYPQWFSSVVYSIHISFFFFIFPRLQTPLPADSTRRRNDQERNRTAEKRHRTGRVPGPLFRGHYGNRHFARLHAGSFIGKVDH
jgi:hypothetical protein